MGVFEQFPYSNFHDLNLNWILNLVKSLDCTVDDLEDWKNQHELDYKLLSDKVEGILGNLTDIITPWDSSIAYLIYSIVEYQGTNYIALQDVPVGVMITNTDYWIPSNTVVEQINAISVSVSELEKKIPFVTPEEYGAAGDGTTDDTQPIQNAFDSGSPVYFSKKKTYRITSTINMNKFNQKIVGNGAALLADFDGTAISIDGTTSFAYRTYFSLAGLVFKKAASPNASYSSNNSTAIKMEHVANMVMDDVYINGFNTGIEINNSLILTFRNVTVNNGEIGIYHNDSTLSGMNDTSFYDCKFINLQYALFQNVNEYLGKGINFYGCQFEQITAPAGHGVFEITSVSGHSTDTDNLISFDGCWIEQCKPTFIKHYNGDNKLEQFTFISCKITSSGAESFIHSTKSCNATLVSTEDPSVYSSMRFRTDTSTWNVLCIASGADGLSRRWGYITRDMRMPKAELLKEATFKVQGSSTTHSIRDSGNYLYFDVTEGRDVARGWCFHATYTNPIFSDASGGNVYLWFANNHLYGKTVSRPSSATDGTIII